MLDRAREPSSGRAFNGRKIEMGKFKGMFFAAAFATLGVIGIGCDDDDPFVAESEFDAIDLDDDGLISAAEWDTAFGTWDLNDDGFLAQSEYLLDGGFTDLDVDANGLLSEAEWNAALTDWDLDGDYFLEPYELSYFY
jgi:hypothetical protein